MMSKRFLETYAAGTHEEILKLFFCIFVCLFFVPFLCDENVWGTDLEIEKKTWLTKSFVIAAVHIFTEKIEFNDLLTILRISFMWLSVNLTPASICDWLVFFFNWINDIKSLDPNSYTIVRILWRWSKYTKCFCFHTRNTKST